jgi:hypothetical protein
MVVLRIDVKKLLLKRRNIPRGERLEGAICLGKYLPTWIRLCGILPELMLGFHMQPLSE